MTTHLTNTTLPKPAYWVCLTLALLLAAGAPSWAAEPKVVLGLATDDAAKYNVEFMRFDRTIPLYTENNIQASLMESSGLVIADWPEDKLYQTFKQYHVIAIGTPEEGVFQLDEKFRKRAEVAGKALARYVKEGGGLLLKPHPVRYPGSDDEKYWNLVFAPFGLEILHEGVFDKTRAFEGTTLGKATFWFTRNLQAHPVTKDVPCLYLPLHAANGPLPGLVAMKYSPDWKVIARGENEARSYRSGSDNTINLAEEGACPNAPPVVAARPFGEGRIVCYPICDIFTGANYGNPLWTSIVETQGDAAANRPSFSMKLLMNAYRWLGEPALAKPEFGAYRPEPYQPAQFPPTVEWSQPSLALTPEQIAAVVKTRAVVGAHSAYSDGKGTVAQYVEAAKAAGAPVIVFTDPLEKLTAEKLTKLKADCAEASQAGDCYACPGLEFTDGIGNRWAFWGEKVVWPAPSFKSGTFTYMQWDGKKVNHYGQYADACGLPGSALLDYRQLRKNGAHPENLWWFYRYFPLAYDHGKLIADNFREYLFGLRDIRWAAVASFTRITDPAEVAQAAKLCHTGFNNLSDAKAALNTRCANESGGQFVSQGPSILSWGSVNNQMETNWKYTRGAQRVRLYFAAQSDPGIAEVRVHDADRGPIRRFLGRGEQTLAREFELVHDQQRYLVLEVIDTAGKRAFSGLIRVFCYKSGLFRCGDNLNILGPTAMCWHPDRNEFFNAAKDFRNGGDYSLRGWDTASAGTGVPSPVVSLWDMANLRETEGWYPDVSRLGAVPGRRMDIGINSYDLQIATMRMNKLAERYDNDKRPTPALATVPRDVGDLEFFDRTHTIYAPMERVDMYITWNFRRDQEGRQNYRGAIIWHEGEFRFKKDCTLRGAVPIPLIWERCPTDLAKNIGTTFLVTDADGATRVGMIRDEKKPLRMQGRIRPGGYAAWLTTPVGYHGLLVPADMDLAYDAVLPSWSGLSAGIGKDGQTVKAGAALKYRFGVATFADEEAGNALLEHTTKAMNLGGGQAGYPVQMKVGEVRDAVFFFTAAAARNEALFTLGPQQLIMDLPIRVRGLENNGCAAVFTTARKWFRYIPVDAQGTAWFTEPIDAANEIWAGNVFTCDRKDVKLTLVVDGQSEGQKPFLELHNPTDQEIETTVRSPEHAPVFGGLSGSAKIPAGDSIRLRINGKKLEP
ncbi:MAG: hypothetical protein HY360_09740 [Verrucomicrobia bacterium]|nr:hypothetical protein [Verrucomicrobiota bacterium]